MIHTIYIIYTVYMIFIICTICMIFIIWFCNVQNANIGFNCVAFCCEMLEFFFIKGAVCGSRQRLYPPAATVQFVQIAANCSKMQQRAQKKIS